MVYLSEAQLRERRSHVDSALGSFALDAEVDRLVQHYKQAVTSAA